MKRKLFVIALGIFAVQQLEAQQQPAFRRADLPTETRVQDLMHTLTLQEKISLLGYNSPAIERLGIPAYNWWNEALHGIARGGEATVYPQAVGLSSTFDPELAKAVANSISTEARAKYNLSVAKNRHVQYMGLNFWTPNVNIFRDPRWGRGQETYGEDPYLTATMAGAFVKGLQGDDPEHLKTAACAKHFAVHSGPEADRHHFNAIVDEKDLRETYLYAFKKMVDGKVESIMCAYNRVNSQPCCTGNTLLQDILRKEWKFTGQVVTDCWALDDIWQRHKAIPTREEVAAAAIKAGVNLDCANILQDDVMKAINKGWLTTADVDSALIKSIRTQMKLGLYNNPADRAYANYGADSVNNAWHTQLALEAARKSMVLLKNNGVLPLQHDKYSSMLVTGSNSASLEALMGNYHGVSGNMVTFAAGLSKAAGPAVAMQYDQGCDFTDTLHFGGIWASENCDVTVAVIGLTPLLEGEDGDAFLSPAGGDKNTLSLPRSQVLFMKKLRAAHKKPIIAVITAGSAVDIAEIEPYADAIILAWYPGEQGGNALADLIYGKYSPSGRLPITLYKSVNDLPNYNDYSMKNRTYRYFTGKPAWPFGFGMSYTTFNFGWNIKPQEKYKKADTIRMSVKVSNTGNYDADEVVQAYISYPAVERMPLKELKAFGRVHTTKGGTQELQLAIPVAELQKWDLQQGKWRLYPGKYTVHVGGDSQQSKLTASFSIK
ncbi:glycoside hydrolase family 3 N-terminal domain-containing protein [Chitinophaga sp. CB10]|uniref:glycoside hydrolase family 3 N-terminal domain-containing protein n=1 Tax=Chitinophaga sp. CB10 TaxID=1891659 RepID=UPI0025BE9266|nr:glycoside hydrolase family 3 N-terminal domain-containing protein [Chitinophaga sp. CB10]